MPAFDRTGPQGQGPITGRGMGYCQGGWGMHRGMGRGIGRGRGRGLGRYFGWNAPQSKNERIADMEDYQKALKEELEDLEKELADLKKQE